MAVDIIEQIKQYVSNADVQKIDPNTQAPVNSEIQNTNAKSAAIPLVLAAFYKHTRNKEDAEKILRLNDEQTMHELFRGEDKNASSIISSFSNDGSEHAKNTIQKIIGATKKVLSDNLKKMDGESVTNFFTSQRSTILKHLPVELHAGDLLNDSTMDDKTNKMEGPMSGLMHGIEKIFSSTK